MVMKTKRFLAVAIVVVALLTTSCGMLDQLLHQRDGGGEAGSPQGDASLHKQVLLVGTYTDAGSEGVYSYTMDAGSADLKHTGTFITPNPSYLALDRDKRVVYIANEDGEKSMVTSALLDTRNGRLSAINSSYTLGKDPAYVATNDRDKVVTANYGSGSITLFKMNSKGLLGEPDWRIALGQEGASHPHSAYFSPNGKELFVTDLGLDKVFHFNVNASGNPPITIGENGVDLPEGSGPRHIIMDRQGKYAYVIAEKSPKVFVFQYVEGSLRLTQEVALRLAPSTYGQHIALSHDGKYLYTSHTDGENVISIFKVDKGNGQLTQVGKQVVGKKPRHFAISPDGSMMAVACRVGNRVEFYKRDLTTGLLAPIRSMDLQLSHPAFVLWIEQY